MSVGRDGLSSSETLAVAAIETGVPLPVEARELIAGLQGMIRTRAAAELGARLAQARSSLVASFAMGIMKD